MLHFVTYHKDLPIMDLHNYEMEAMPQDKLTERDLKRKAHLEFA